MDHIKGAIVTDTYMYSDPMRDENESVKRYSYAYNRVDKRGYIIPYCKVLKNENGKVSRILTDRVCINTRRPIHKFVSYYRKKGFDIVVNKKLKDGEDE